MYGRRDSSLESITTKTIAIIYYLVLAIYVIGIISCVIAGIIFFANCYPVVKTNHYGDVRELNPDMLTQGILCLTAYPIGWTFLWIIERIALGFFYDVKLIRYHLDDKQ